MCIKTYIYVNTHMYVYICKNIYIYLYIYIYIYIYICRYVEIGFQSWTSFLFWTLQYSAHLWLRRLSMNVEIINSASLQITAVRSAYSGDVSTLATVMGLGVHANLAAPIVDSNLRDSLMSPYLSPSPQTSQASWFNMSSFGHRSSSAFFGPYRLPWLVVLMTRLGVERQVGG